MTLLKSTSIKVLITLKSTSIKVLTTLKSTSIKVLTPLYGLKNYTVLLSQLRRNHIQNDLHKQEKNNYNTVLRDQLCYQNDKKCQQINKII